MKLTEHETSSGENTFEEKIYMLNRRSPNYFGKETFFFNASVCRVERFFVVFH